MRAILKREINGYFTTPIGYIYLAAFVAVASFYWFSGSLVYLSPETSYLFSNLVVITTFILPILTMRLFTEEKKLKTDQLLLTSPVSLLGLVLGKYVSALVVYALGLSVTLVFGAIMSLFGTVEWMVLLGNVLGLFLLGAAIISIGMFISSLTENQVIAAVGGFVAALLLYVIDAFSSIIPISWFSKLLTGISFYSHYSSFPYGIIDLTDVLFFLSAIAFFVFLTVRVLERRRWN